MSASVKRNLRKLAPFLLQAREEGLNEADTVQRLVKVLEDVFGYDAMGEITREKQVKGTYVDLAIKVDGRIRFFIEAKAAGVVLRERYIEQAERYAAEDGVEWVLLTNGVQWHLYHLTFDEGIEYDRVVDLDLLVDDIDVVADQLAVLHRDSVRKEGLVEYWKEKSALNAESVIAALFHEDTLRTTRREIRRKVGLLVDEEDLADAIKKLLSPEALEQCGPIRIKRKRRPRPTADVGNTPSGSVTVPVATPHVGRQGEGAAPRDPAE